MKPTIGRIVHIEYSPMPEIPTVPKIVVPAIVTRVHKPIVPGAEKPGTVIDAVAFSATEFQDDPTRAFTNVGEKDTDVAGEVVWFWPPRV